MNSTHTVIYTLSLHVSLPISRSARSQSSSLRSPPRCRGFSDQTGWQPHLDHPPSVRSEEHTYELHSHSDLHSFPTRLSSDLTLGEVAVLLAQVTASMSWVFGPDWLATSPRPSAER